MSQRLIALAAVAVLGGFTTSSHAHAAGAIRPEHADVTKLINEGTRRSATFKGLIERLNATGLVVYVRFAACPGAVACTRFVAPQGATRRVLVVLDRFGRGPSDLIVLLAHELQHALEIADSPQVVDEASFRHFYATTGLWHGAGYETAAAIHVARTVGSELLAHPHR